MFCWALHTFPFALIVYGNAWKLGVKTCRFVTTRPLNAFSSIPKCFLCVVFDWDYKKHNSKTSLIGLAGSPTSLKSSTSAVRTNAMITTSKKAKKFVWECFRTAHENSNAALLPTSWRYESESIWGRQIPRFDHQRRTGIVKQRSHSSPHVLCHPFVVFSFTQKD